MFAQTIRPRGRLVGYLLPGRINYCYSSAHDFGS